VQKKGKLNAGKLNYSYAGEADLISALRPAMVDAGIIVYPHEIKEVNCESYITEKTWNGTVTKSRQNRTVTQTIFRFTHAVSGTHVDVPAIGAGIDSGDKDVYKAMTGAFKYALRQAFMIETGDDPDQVVSPAPEPVKEPEPKPKEPKEFTEKEWQDKADKVIGAFKAAKTKEVLTKVEAAFKEKLERPMEIYAPNHIASVQDALADKTQEFSTFEDGDSSDPGF